MLLENEPLHEKRYLQTIESSDQPYNLCSLRPMVVRRSDTRTPSKPSLKTATYQQSRGNRLHRMEQSGEAS